MLFASLTRTCLRLLLLVGEPGERGRAFVGLSAEGPWRTTVRQARFLLAVVLDILFCYSFRVIRRNHFDVIVYGYRGQVYDRYTVHSCT